ncbi:hypothetical protein DID76_04335, partial [Candidatus Marinamargulisbacteria bacterium SCGC AG-414-C22]
MPLFKPDRTSCNNDVQKQSGQTNTKATSKLFRMTSLVKTKTQKAILLLKNFSKTNNSSPGRHEDKPFDRRAFRKVAKAYCWSSRPDDRDTMKGLLENSTGINMENKGERLSTIAHEIAWAYGKNPKAAKALNDIMQMLIENGADINKQNELGETPLHLAANIAANNKGRTTMELLLEKGADINIQNEAGDTPLHIADRNGDHATMKLLLEKGADINMPNKAGDTLLHIAAKKDDHATMKLLLEKGADINKQNEKGDTLLHIAAENGDHDTMKLLLENDADINIQNEKGDTPFHKFYVRSWTTITIQSVQNTMKLLLDNGADFNIQNKAGDNLLHIAAKLHGRDTMKLLLEKGANINTPNKAGDTLLHIAAKNGDYKAVKLLLDIGADLDNGADINIQNEDGDTFLHIAIQVSGRRGSRLPPGGVETEKMAELLAKGADIKAKNKQGDTLLHMATLKAIDDYKYDTMKLLLENGANIHEPNNDGKTPLHVAANIALEDPLSIEGSSAQEALILMGEYEPEINEPLNGANDLFITFMDKMANVAKQFDPRVNVLASIDPPFKYTGIALLKNMDIKKLPFKGAKLVAKFLSANGVNTFGKFAKTKNRGRLEAAANILFLKSELPNIGLSRNSSDEEKARHKKSVDRASSLIEHITTEQNKFLLNDTAIVYSLRGIGRDYARKIYSTYPENGLTQEDVDKRESVKRFGTNPFSMDEKGEYIYHDPIEILNLLKPYKSSGPLI